ncbi:DUF1289 domain-containing protein [Thalassotalea sp. LPB0316]|nr:DUF1289 domain-containing protein [Thalassotalea sp. LPB0316]QOL27287.1 DUF1289 domain-containing protein [Thalassotalea sp. LPB0316]
MIKNKTPNSPCIDNCCLDEQDVCTGCYRTINEICQWRSMSDAEKIDVYQRIAKRKLYQVN